ncbi:MAG: response regulator [Patescibacteria group bacterium]|nr:response regulator [Patescibacteria group bacterium]
MKSKKILIIEDEAALLYALKARLTVDGYSITTVDSGEKALEALEKDEPDLIVLDIILPQMSGYDFLKEIKENDKYRDIPVVIMSNLSKKGDIEKGLKLGAKDYLIKTEFNLDDFINKIKKVIKNG